MSMAQAYAGPDSDLEPNARDISAFIGWWFQYCTRGQIEIGWLDVDGRGLTHFQRFELGSQEIVASIILINSVPGQSIYFRSSTVRERTDGAYTTDADFIQAPGPWGDIDTPEQMKFAKSIQSIVRPNGSVITGTMPHPRAQSFFRVSEPVANPVMIRSLNRRIHKLYGGDPAVVNPTRLMRMPGTIAWPWKPERVPELTKFATDSNRPTSYPLSLLTSQLPAEDDAGAAPPPKSGARATLNTVSEFVRLIRSGASWHDAMIRLVAHWTGRGWSNTEILLAVESLPNSEWRSKIDWREVEKAINGARSKWGLNDQEHIIGDASQSPFPKSVVDPWDTLQAPEFPMHGLPTLLQAFVEERSRVMGADPCALAWACLSAASAAIHGRMRIRLKKHDTWSVPPSIWVALIGRSSAKKTPIINEAWRPLEEAQRRIFGNYRRQLDSWNAMPKEQKAASKEPPKPLRLVSHDATMEGLQDVLANQERGIGVIRDELAGFIGSMDKYSNGKGGAADRAFWLQSYNGGSHIVDRVGRGTVVIDNLLTTIIGGIQPDRLVAFKDIADDGMWQRFVPLIMKQGEMGVDEAPSDVVEAYANRLATMMDTSGSDNPSLSEGAHEVRELVEREIFSLETLEPINAKFASFIGKLPGLFGRLCLVLSYLEPDGLGYIISKRHAEMARTLIKQCVIPHASRVYLTMGEEGASAEHIKAIAGFILSKNLSRVLLSDFTRSVRLCRRMTVPEILKVVSPLIASGWLVPENDLPTNRVWLVNPLVHVKFAHRATIEKSRRLAARDLITGDDEDDDYA